jgi:hypothetical protein
VQSVAALWLAAFDVPRLLYRPAGQPMQEIIPATTAIFPAEQTLQTLLTFSTLPVPPADRL